MQNLQEEIKNLKEEKRILQQKLDKANQDIKIYINNIQQYDEDKQRLIDEKQKLERKLQFKPEQKEVDLERKIRQIIERIPCQIDQKSLRNITQSIIQKERGILMDLVVAYKDAYKDDYSESQRCQCQSLFEAFYIIGIKHKQLKEMHIQKNVEQLKPKFLYKQYKSGINSYEREILIETEEDIKTNFQQNLINVEKLDNYQYIEDNLTRFLYERNTKEYIENLYFFNLSSCENLFEEQIPQNMELLTSFNKDKQLFFFSLSVDDYISSFQEGRFQFWKFKKYYCFLTFFPISEIFDQLLIFAANLIKALRSDVYLQYKLEQSQRQRMCKQKESLEQQFIQKIYQDIDACNILYKAKDEIQHSIKLISDLYLSNDKPKIQINFQTLIKNKIIQIPQQNLIYSLPDNFLTASNTITREIYIKNRIKHTHVVMQIFTFDDFFTIFMEILKEGQILFLCENLNILSSVCYFFHLIIYPFIWVQPAVYCSNTEVLEILLQERIPFILGLNQQYSQLKLNNNNNNQPLNYRNLTIVELIVKKEADYSIKSLIRQNNGQNHRLKLKSFPYFQIKDMLEKYKHPEDAFQPTYNDQESKICHQFLYKMINIVENDFILKIIPESDPDFIKGGLWNKELVKYNLMSNLKSNENAQFIIAYLFESEYFESFLKHKYNYKDI